MSNPQQPERERDEMNADDEISAKEVFDGMMEINNAMHKEMMEAHKTMNAEMMAMNRAMMKIINSTALPNVTFKSAPTVSPSLMATLSVA